MSTPDCVTRRILIAGIGNVFLGDDGFGVEVVHSLTGRTYPAGVQISDFGIRGFDLAYTLLDGYETLILVDAVPRGGAPGTLYLIEPDLSGFAPRQGAEAERAGLDAHSMDPVKVLAFASTLGAQLPEVLLVGCEPAPIDSADDYTGMHIGLSAPVQAAAVEAVKMIDTLVEQLLNVHVVHR